MTSAASIVASIRARQDGAYAMSESEAELMVNLFASVAATKAERDTMIRVGDHAPEPLNENISEGEYNRSEEALAHILGGVR